MSIRRVSVDMLDVLIGRWPASTERNKMTTKEETIKYELSNDQKGLMRFCIAFDQNGEEDRFTYHVHSDELTRLEKWIHGLLLDRSASKDAPNMVISNKD